MVAKTFQQALKVARGKRKGGKGPSRLVETGEGLEIVRSTKRAAESKMISIEDIILDELEAGGK